MANEEHLNMLKQGPAIWKDWRAKHFEIYPDLSGAELDNLDLSGAHLSYTELQGANLQGTELSDANLRNAELSDTSFSSANLTGADLTCANLRCANLSRANLFRAELSEADLNEADLSGARLSRANLHNAELSHAKLCSWDPDRFGANTDLSDADLSNADLSGADLSYADLSGTDLSQADLSGANLSSALLGDTNLRKANLNGTVFQYAKTYRTIFVDIDLRSLEGLETIVHRGPSEISISSIQLSEGGIPEKFLRGCGLSDWEIESVKIYNPKLSNEELTEAVYRIHDLRAHQAIQINPLFISYSHADRLYVDEMEKYLNKKGIRFWRDIHHATAGRLETQIDRAIRLNPTVLLVLSEHSVDSDWVQHEARLARKLELETKRDVLCPVALDDKWKDSRWPERLREQIMEYNILDFSDWKNKDTFQHMFGRLLEGLDLFYK